MCLVMFSDVLMMSKLLYNLFNQENAFPPEWKGCCHKYAQHLHNNTIINTIYGDASDTNISTIYNFPSTAPLGGGWRETTFSPYRRRMFSVWRESC